MERYKEIERSIITTYRSRLWSKFMRAIKEYELIKENDRICVCISGGKDSMLLCKCMQELLAHGDVKFELHFIAMDPGYNKENRELIIENAKMMNIPILGIIENYSYLRCEDCGKRSRCSSHLLYQVVRSFGSHPRKHHHARLEGCHHQRP